MRRRRPRGGLRPLRIDRAAIPFVLLASLPAVAAGAFGAVAIGASLLTLPIGTALFFRDPERTIDPDPALVLSPADGRVMYAGEARPDEAPPGAWRQITVFLSVLDVHINRTPVAGRVDRVEYVPGSFLPAYRRGAHANEHSEIWLNHGGTAIVVRQVVGMLARRVVCRVRPGDDLAAGARIGLMKFGSRMDVFLPVDATIATRAGATVRAGETVVARLATR
jgi:phosphatidylserine decarboxylase